MPRPSSIDRLPPEIREKIGRLRQAGRTIDEILACLADLDTRISRSALGRHVKGFAEMADYMLRSRSVAEALGAEFKDAPGSKTAQVNIELLHSAVLDLFLQADGEELDAGGKAAKAGNPDGLMKLAKALDHLGRASKSNVEFLALAEKRAADQARAEAVEAVEAVAASEGLSASAVRAIRAGILGVK